MKQPPTTPLVNRDSATRRARRLDVEFDVGDLCFALRSVRSREAAPASIKSLARPVLWLACEVQLIGCGSAESFSAVRCPVKKQSHRHTPPRSHFYPEPQPQSVAMP